MSSCRYLCGGESAIPARYRSGLTGANGGGILGQGFVVREWTGRERFRPASSPTNFCGLTGSPTVRWDLDLPKAQACPTVPAVPVLPTADHQSTFYTTMPVQP